MAQGNESAEFKVNLAGNAADVAKTTATAMEGMRKRIAEGRSALEGLNDQMKALKSAKGSADAIKDLKSKIDAQKASSKGATSELKKQSEALREASKAAKAQGAESAKLKGILDKTAKQYKELTDKRKAAADEAFATKMKASEESMTSLNGAVLGVVGVLAALAIGFISAGIAAAKFVLRGADAARSVGLLREAAMNGNAQWGRNFGEQVDALARKVPTSKAEIDALGISLAKSRIGGQVWVDTLNLVTQASAALGNDAGNALKGFIERGRQFNRFQLNPLEMVGTGIDFKDVAEALSKSMKIGVKDATQALFEGRVKLADGAAALRAAVEKKVGGVNLRQMLSFDNLLKKMGESFDELTKGIDLEPMLKGFKEIANIFSITTTSGQALKQIVEVFGAGLTASFAGATPLAKKFIYGAIIGAQELVIAYLQVRNSLKKTFGDSEVLKNVDTLKLALAAGKFAAYGIAAAMVVVAGAVALAVLPFALLYGAVMAFQSAGEAVGKWFRETDWSGLGTSIVDGLIAGLKLGANGLKNAVMGLAEGTKNTFKDVLGIHSPARAFVPLGKALPDGVGVGVDDGTDDLNKKVGGMVNVPSAGGGGGGRGGAPVIVNLTINASGADAKAVAAAVSDESILEKITKVILEAVQGGGIPVPQ
jgi:hypothetical protein